MNIIQDYLPTTNHTDEEVDKVYEDIDNLITYSKAYFNIIMGYNEINYILTDKPHVFTDVSVINEHGQGLPHGTRHSDHQHKARAAQAHQTAKETK